MAFTGAKIGEHDLTGDAKFVNAPLLVLKSDSNAATRSKITLRGPLQGRLAAGDTVEVLVMDGSARDAKPRKVTDAIEIDLPPIGNRGGAQGGAPRKGSVITFDPPLASDPGAAPVFVYKWPAGAKDLVSDFRLKADSPAIDSADSSVKRGPDMDGHEATDAPGVENTGAGSVKHLDRGAFEFVPPK